MTRSLPARHSPFTQSRAFDLLAAAPLVVWYCFSLVGIMIESRPQIVQIFTHMDFRILLELGSQLASMVFLGLQIVLFLIRKLPVEKAAGWPPRVAGLVGSNLQLLFLALPRSHLATLIEVISTSLVILGTSAAIYAAVHLGRSFSILPQARHLVTRGPYTIIRHPLYLAEQVATWGVMLQFIQPWALLLAIASFTAQFPRMHYEEQVLQTAFPAYPAYAAHTRRFIPGIY
jgi:protein-S-isoprenylcysteine O-methyltransferase Ste14